jgi:AcrR family transcriptional regulator
MTVAATRRARDDGAKAARREAILDAVDGLFATLPYEAITMATVAERCRLAKGTLYLYFPTREAMFLALYLRHAAGLAANLAALSALHSSPDKLAFAIAEAFDQRRTLLKLMGLSPTVFEHNISADVAGAFKHDLIAVLSAPAAALGANVPALGGEGLRFLVRVAALAAGLAEMAYPAPVVAGILAADPALHPLRVDFREELAGTVAALLRGWR